MPRHYRLRAAASKQIIRSALGDDLVEYLFGKCSFIVARRRQITAHQLQFTLYRLAGIYDAHGPSNSPKSKQTKSHSSEQKSDLKCKAAACFTALQTIDVNLKVNASLAIFLVFDGSTVLFRRLCRLRRVHVRQSVAYHLGAACTDCFP